MHNIDQDRKLRCVTFVYCAPLRTNMAGKHEKEEDYLRACPAGTSQVAKRTLVKQVPSRAAMWEAETKAHVQKTIEDALEAGKKVLHLSLGCVRPPLTYEIVSSICNKLWPGEQPAIMGTAWRLNSWGTGTPDPTVHYIIPEDLDNPASFVWRMEAYELHWCMDEAPTVLP